MLTLTAGEAATVITAVAVFVLSAREVAVKLTVAGWGMTAGAV
jgi:hypothetical protein